MVVKKGSFRARKKRLNKWASEASFTLAAGEMANTSVREGLLAEIQGARENRYRQGRIQD